MIAVVDVLSKLLFCASLLVALPSLAAQTLLGQADLDGDGVVESIYKDGSQLVIKSSGSSYSYPMGSNWYLIFGDSSIGQTDSAAVDLDGVAGKELMVNSSGVLVVVTHRTRSTTRYVLNGGWAVSPRGVVDMDGQPGAEIAVLTGPSLTVITQRTQSKRSFNVSSAAWSVIVAGISDLNGRPGADIPINTDTNSFMVVNEGTSAANFNVGFRYSVAGAQDFSGDGKIEFALTDFPPGYGSTKLVVINPVNGSLATYSQAGYFRVVGFVSRGTGGPGTDIQIFSDTYQRNITLRYNGSLYVVN